MNTLIKLFIKKIIREVIFLLKHDDQKHHSQTTNYKDHNRNDFTLTIITVPRNRIKKNTNTRSTKAPNLFLTCTR